MKNSVLVTITGLAHYYGTKPFKVAKEVTHIGDWLFE